MAGRIKDEDVKAVRDAVPIDAVVSEYLQLKNAGGGNLKGLCPFHDEKSPSFQVSPSKGLYHCLAGETRVLTWDGVREIRELAGGSHRVLTRSGNWYEAPFRSFGTQALLKVTLGRNGQRKEIFATAEHRWFVRSGTNRYNTREVVTKDLKPEHRLSYVFPGSRVQQTTPSPFGIAHGITFGDGTLNDTGSMAQLDPVKDAELLRWFPNSTIVESPRQIVVHHLPKFFKSLPPLDESVPYLYGWLAGYVAADGHVAEDGTVSLNCASRETLEYVRTVATRLGIGTYGITQQTREGFPGREPSAIFRVHFIHEDLTEEFFLNSGHRKRYLDSAKQLVRRGWTVKSVEPTDRVEEVYCATVEQGAAFVLEDNILTGNCFGCGEGGDTLAFVMKVDHLSFTEAVERLAGQAGITLRYEEGSHVPGRQQGERIRLVEAHKAAALFYVEQLGGAEAEIGRRFLAERGFDQAAAEHFGVGYAPAGWDHLVRFLRGKGFSDKELITAGLASESRRGGAIDRFRGRLIWPIRDITGEVIGFGARKLRDDDQGPKYLNTSETPLYRKSQVLYGIDLAKKEIARTGRAVVVEGYTDVMACHLAGVTTAIATCGTSFGGDHIKILRRLLMDNSGAEVVFTFDGDEAGQKAALRAFEDDQKFAAETSIAITPGGMDPCELRLAEGDAAVQRLIEGRTPLFAFALRSIVARYNLDTDEGRVAAVDAAVAVVAAIKNQALRDRYAIRLVGMAGIASQSEEQSVIRRVRAMARARAAGGGSTTGRPEYGRQGGGGYQSGGYAGGGQGSAAPAQNAARGPRLDLRSPAHRVERELLKLALQYPKLVSPAFDAYGEDEFTGPPYIAVRRVISEAGGVEQADGDYLVRVRDAAPDDSVRMMVTELAVEPVMHKSPEFYAGQVLVDVRLNAVKRRVAQVQATIARLDAQGVPDGVPEVAAAQSELWALQQYGQRLRELGAAGL
ncbi:DNA primase [Streptomyces sp. NPDC051976]|uniref:DNA primase n=1 Tax=Streptomyces sp. NPDC051976 TaxID=3154947 RepID=UPI00342EF9D4